MKIKNIVILAFVVLGFVACEEEEEPATFSQTQIFDIDNGVFNTNTYIEVADAHSGKKISRADVGNNYGFGYSYVLPDSLIGKDIAVNIDGWVRSGDLSSNCEFVVSASSKDSILLWQGCGVKNIMKAVNQWSNLNTVIIIPSTLTTKPNIKITLLAHNIDAKSFFDVDDLKVTFYEPTQP